ncbi:PaaI family thioesterase [Psychrobacter sp. CAL346-MNA-CIBAN-0220]|uniref:PaaI family thioesterase n=1 Tax=Psychrobacter sp. CAL346-MNA-CIBAN-0220 TaxID=3140457 RepID=UPI0033212D2A
MINANSNIISKYGHIIKKQIDEVFPAWVLNNFSVEIIELTAGKALYELAYNPDLYRKVPGPNASEILSGQAIMTLADSLLIFPVLTQIGQAQEIVTLSSNTEFLRPIKAGKITINAEVIRAGSKVIRGQVSIFDADNKLCALSILCYIYI